MRFDFNTPLAPSITQTPHAAAAGAKEDTPLPPAGRGPALIALPVSEVLEPVVVVVVVVIVVEYVRLRQFD